MGLAVAVTVVAAVTTAPAVLSLLGRRAIAVTRHPVDAATAELVDAVRAATATAPGAEVSVAGRTALDVNVNTALVDALPRYVGVIVAPALVLLFRSIPVILVGILFGPATDHQTSLVSAIREAGSQGVAPWAWGCSPTPRWCAWWSCRRRRPCWARPPGGCRAGCSGSCRTSTPRGAA